MWNYSNFSSCEQEISDFFNNSKNNVYVVDPAFRINNAHFLPLERCLGVLGNVGKTLTQTCVIVRQFQSFVTAVYATLFISGVHV